MLNLLLSGELQPANALASIS
uniref:Uncharacterized protein n=1 Tax=Arundo donax TaxID=35708 RepID=A0A0A9BVY4_ARUDO